LGPLTARDQDGPIAGLTRAASVVVGKDGKVKHVEYVKEIDPNRTTTRRWPREVGAS